MAAVGCSKHDISDITPKTHSFKCDFTITESELYGTMTVSSDRDLTVVFSGPDRLAGFGMTVQSDGVIIEVQGITEKYQINEIPPESPALKLYSALLSAEKLTPYDSNGEITVNDDEFTAALNGTGYITMLSFKKQSLEVMFSNHVDIK